MAVCCDACAATRWIRRDFEGQLSAALEREQAMSVDLQAGEKNAGRHIGGLDTPGLSMTL